MRSIQLASLILAVAASPILGQDVADISADGMITQSTEDRTSAVDKIFNLEGRELQTKGFAVSGLGIRSTRAPSVKSTKAPSIKSTSAPSIKSTSAPSIKSTSAPSIKSTSAPSIKSTAAPSIKSRRELVFFERKGE